MDIICESSPQSPGYTRISKRCFIKFTPERHTISGNFSRSHRCVDVDISNQYTSRDRSNMKKDLFSIGSKKEAKVFDQMLDDIDSNEVYPCENPVYEDPRDVIGDKPIKPPRKKVSAAPALTSPRAMSKEARILLKEQKRKLTKKYENLIVSIMERCEENVLLITEKEAIIAKLKEKLKAVLEYNTLFADENDTLKEQYTAAVRHIEDCKTTVQELQNRDAELTERSKELEARVAKFEVPDRDRSDLSSAIPLVEVCMSCSSRQIVLQQAREHNSRLLRDMQALKDVLYRLNVQLARYRERLQNNVPSLSGDGRDPCAHKITSDPLDSLITSSVGYKQDAANTEDGSKKSGRDTPTRVADLSGLLSAQALIPLFDAYQDNIQEKENLIMDYEKQFENLNIKSKQLVAENKSLREKVSSLEEELVHLSKSQRKLAMERETVEMEKQTLQERAEKVELKLKEVYELYEDKMAAMMRDYETVHREYFAAKSALAASEGKMERMDTLLRARTVPADLHERRVDHCKRLLDELKHQYSMESERTKEQIQKLQEQNNILEEKYNRLSKDHGIAKEELATALKNVRLYRKAAAIFRGRLRASAAALSSLRRSTRRRASPHDSAKVDAIRREIKAVKTRAYSTLEELERRILQQERRAARAAQRHRRDLDRAHAALRHKDDVIARLIDQVADVEEIRLSQGGTHQRLQGIVSESSPERSSSPKLSEPQREETRKEETRREENRREGTRRDEKALAPGHGGYYRRER